MNKPTLLVGADGNPVSAYTIGDDLMVQRFDGNQWVGIGPNQGRINSGGQRGGASVAALGADGIPVIAWKDAQHSGGTFVQRFTGTAWEPVGPAAGKLPVPMGMADFRPSAMVLDAAGRPVLAGLASLCSTLGCSVTSDGFAAYRFDGTQWLASGGHTAMPMGYFSGGWGLTSLALQGDAPVLAFVESDSKSTKLFIDRWTGTAWQSLAFPVEAMQLTGMLSHPSLITDAQGRLNVVVARRLPTPGVQALEIYGHVQ